MAGLAEVAVLCEEEEDDEEDVKVSGAPGGRRGGRRGGVVARVQHLEDRKHLGTMRNVIQVNSFIFYS